MINTKQQQVEIKIKKPCKGFVKDFIYMVSKDKAEKLVEDGKAIILSRIKNKLC